MKKALLLIFGLSFSLMSTSAAEILTLSTGEKNPGNTNLPPERTITKGDNWIEVSYKFAYANITEEATSGTYIWQYPGFGNNHEKGLPAVPRRSDSFIVPGGCIANIEILHSHYKDFEMTLSTAVGFETASFTDDNEYIQQETCIYTVFPDTIISESIQKYRGINILNVTISPIQYDAVDKKVRAHTEVQYRITYDYNDDIALYSSNSKPYIAPTDKITDSSCFIRVDDSETVEAQNLTTGGDLTITVPGFPMLGMITQSYLILTTTDMLPAAEKLANWKKRMGYRMIIETADSWTVESVKAKIQEVYNQTPTLYYVLLIGDQTVVPANFNAQKSPSEYTYLSDNEYYCLDGEGDFYPDVFGGRIPVATLEKAMNVIDKTLQYESNCSDDPSYLSSAVLAARFQDNNLPGNMPDGYEDTRFIKTTEEIRHYISDKYEKITRFYSLPPGCTPTHYNNGAFSFGEEIPDELRPENFKWEQNVDSIFKAINDGCSLLYYYGHGATEGWMDPYFVTDNFWGLKNKNKYPICLNVICFTGRYEKENNFIRNLISLKDAGCVAAIGSVEQTFAYDDDALLEGIFDAIWPSPGLYPVLKYNYYVPEVKNKPVYSLGEILNAGIIRARETFNYSTNTNSYEHFLRKVLHVFGDPSLMIYWSKEKYSNVYITMDSQFKLSHLGLNDYAYISVYNPTSDTSYRYYTNTFSFNQSTLQGCSLYVTYPGKHPICVFAGSGDINSVNIPEISACSVAGKDKLYVEVSNLKEISAGNRLDVRDIYGNVRVSEDIVEETYEYMLDVSSLNSGIYVVSLTQDNTIVSSKHFVK